MTPASTDPVYNMKVVAQETGMKPDTLRAWERRYGLPDPGRTEGGHRLYSQRDIETIKWLVARQEEGLAISRAVELWNNLEAEGKDPLRAMAYREVDTARSPAELPAGETVAELRETWISACLDFDEPRAERVLTQAFALYPPETVCIELLQKGLARIGELWYQGEATVQQEHFTSALTIRRLNALLEAAPRPIRPERVLIGCPPEEEHTFSPLLLTLMLRRAGWNVFYLGANVPIARFEATIKQINPHLVISTAQQLRTAATLLDVARVLRSESVSFGYGGWIFNRTPALRQRILGHFLGERLAGAGQAVENMVSFPPSKSDVEPVPDTYRAALAHYQEQQAELETYVWQTVKTDGISYEHLANANVYLADNIAAALKLGDMDFLGPELVWVKKLIQNYDMDPELLYRYLLAYRRAAEAHLDERGRSIVDWLARVEENHLENNL